MKKLAFLVVAFFLFFLSCSKDEKPVLTISQTSISAPSAGNSTSITLVANNPWSVSGTDWCTVSPSSGQGEGEITVTITVKENTTYDARNHTLTFISKELSQSLSVSQESNYGIVLPKNTYELSSDAQQISVEVKANVTYEVSIDADWIKENGTKALTSKTYTFDIDANTTYDSREGVITIKEKNGNNVETIKVKQAQKDAIIISSKEYSLSSDAQTLEVKLQTNVDLEVVIPDDAKTWVSHTETKALSDKTVIFDIKANETYDARNSKIVIKKKSTGIADTIKITQAQKNAIIISKKDFELSSEAHTLEIKLQTNVDISVSVSETANDWISHTQTKALTDKTMIVDIKPNDTYGERSGEIYISSSKSNMRDTIKIKQLQNDAIIVSQKEYKLSSEAQTLEVKLQTNVDLEVIIPDDAKSWVSHTETKALSSRSIIFDIKANEYSDTRRCDIIIKKKTTGIADTIKIAQAQKSIIIISKKNYKLSSDAHTLEIPFQSNVEISVAIPEHSKNWISYIQTKALTDKALVIDVKQNDTYSERYGEVYIYNSKSNMRDTINITQLQNDAIIFSQKEYILSSDAQSLEVKLQTNVNLEVIVPVNAKTWVNLIATKALSGKVITFDIKENNTGYDRMSCVYFQNATDNVRDSIKIAQIATQLDNQIWYTTIDNNAVELNDVDLGSTKVISNVSIR